jgi:hypothetical protein
VEIPDPVQEAKDRLAAVLNGNDDRVTAADGSAAVERALDGMKSGYGGRSLGFAVLDSLGRGDGVDYRVVVTDGDQEGVIIARLSRTLIATLDARGEAAEAHVVERLQGAAGSLRNDGNRWLNVVLQPQPLTFHA